MKQTLSDFMTITFILICIATPTITLIHSSQQVDHWNPFLPKNITSNTSTISWPKTPKTRPKNPFLHMTTTTTTKPVINDTIPRYDLPTVEEGCGRNFAYTSVAYIEGGKPARKHDWPFIALLGYGESPYTTFKCGGTLITARHVLTAAHCILAEPTFVRLGEHDLNSVTDTDHIDVPIFKTARHPQYNRRNGRSDIGILYLKWNVEFTSSIQPACMPSPISLRSKSYVGTECTIAGWGKLKEDGNTATVLNELKIPVLENDVCRSSYARLNRHFTQDQFDDAVICAGVLAGGKDSCNGDSGGPLIIDEEVGKEYPTRRSYLIGIVAYGVGCARPGIPGVYTSTQYFLDWVLEKLKETP